MPDKFFPRLTADYLDHLVRQVSAERYHFESLRIFMYHNLVPSEAVHALQLWAAKSGLKVSINHEYELCFFENA